MFLNYPNNPTAACAPLSFFEEAAAFAREHHILIAHDAAYSETYFGDPPPRITHPFFVPARMKAHTSLTSLLGSIIRRLSFISS